MDESEEMRLIPCGPWETTTKDVAWDGLAAFAHLALFGLSGWLLLTNARQTVRFYTDLDWAFRELKDSLKWWLR